MFIFSFVVYLIILIFHKQLIITPTTFNVIANINLLFYMLGLASRLCDGDPAVWHVPNVEECSTVEIIRIKEEVDNLMAIFDASQNPNNSDRTDMVEPEVLQSITDELASVTYKNDTAILPNDLGDTIDTVGTILRLGCFALCRNIYVTGCEKP